MRARNACAGLQWRESQLAVVFNLSLYLVSEGGGVRLEHEEQPGLQKAHTTRLYVIWRHQVSRVFQALLFPREGWHIGHNLNLFLTAESFVVKM